MPTLVLLRRGPGLACSVRTHVVRSLLIRSRVQTFFLFITLSVFVSVSNIFSFLFFVTISVSATQAKCKA
jgi:hypothetical protein